MWNSEIFSTKEDLLQINISGKCQSACEWILYGYTEGGERRELRREAVSDIISIKHEFDPVSYGVYSGAVSFSVSVEGDCTVDNFEVTVPERKVATEKSSSAKFCGDKVAIYDVDGNEILVPYVPQSVLYIGNSLIAGMFDKYGMCCTDPEHDYAYLVSQAISKLSPDCRFKKLHGSNFEHSQSSEDFENWFFTEENVLTGRPAAESFTPDLDLVLIQLMDNVNTPEKVAAFKYNAPRFIEEIKKRCPHARIVWVYGWYGGEITFSLVSDVCEKYKLETVNVASAHTRENEAYSGQISLDADGNEIVVKDIWISHPGNGGMAEIARRILAQLLP